MMGRMLRIALMIVGCGWLAEGGGAAGARPDGPPNFVIVLADDLGYGDLGCYGNSNIQTPHLDRFAAEGLKLTACYAASANCSPARAGLITGRTPARVGIYNWIPMGSPMHLRKSEVTIATLLERANYETCHVGKWHLNGRFNQPTQPQPGDHGFQHWFSTQNNALPNHRRPDNFVRNGADVGETSGYAGEVVADEAIRWLQRRPDVAKPFFLFVCFHEPHEPIATAERYARLYPSDDPSYAAHHGNITQMDDAFGRILHTLDELKLRENTLVLFTSDNGPAITRIHPHGSAGPWRDKKGYLSEGGIRVPGILQWPGRVRKGSTSDEPICGVDLLPTVCEIAAIEPPRDRALDGASFLPALDGKPIERHRPLYWQFHRASGNVKVAIRRGRWKMTARLTMPTPKPSGEIAPGEMLALKAAELTEFALYDLSADPREETDVSMREGIVFTRLHDEMTAMYQEVKAEGPIWPDWEFARYEAERIQWPEYWLNRSQR